MIFVLTLGMTYVSRATEDKNISLSERLISEVSNDAPKVINSDSDESFSPITNNNSQDESLQQNKHKPLEFYSSSMGSTSYAENNFSVISHWANIFQTLQFVVASNNLDFFMKTFILTLFAFLGMILSWLLSSAMGMPIGIFRGFVRIRFRIFNTSNISTNQKISLSSKITLNKSMKNHFQKTQHQVSVNPILYTHAPAIKDAPNLIKKPIVNETIVIEETIVNKPPLNAPVVEDPSVDDISNYSKPNVSDDPKLSPNPVLLSYTTTLLNIAAQLKGTIFKGNETPSNNDEPNTDLIPSTPNLEEEVSSDPNQPSENTEEEVTQDLKPEVRDDTPSSSTKPNQSGSPIISPENDSSQDVADDTPLSNDVDKEDVNTPTIENEVTPGPTPTTIENEVTPGPTTPTIENESTQIPTTPTKQDLPPTNPSKPIINEEPREDINNPGDVPTDLPDVTSDLPNVTSETPLPDQDPKTSQPTTPSNSNSVEPVMLVSLDGSVNMSVVSTTVSMLTPSPGYENSTDYHNYKPQSFEEWTMDEKNNTQYEKVLEESMPNETKDQETKDHLLEKSPFVTSSSPESSGRRLAGETSIETPKSPLSESIDTKPLSNTTQVGNEHSKNNPTKTVTSSRLSFFAMLRFFGSWFVHGLNWIIQNLLAVLLMFTTLVTSFFTILFDRNEKTKNQQEW